MKKFTDIDVLVDDILDRLERSGDAKRLLAHLDDFPSVAHEDAFLAGLHMLERRGGLVVKRGRIDGVDRILNVRADDVDVLYDHRRRTPARSKASNALQNLREAADRPDGIDAVLDEVEEAWSRNVAWSGLLRPGDASSLAAAARLAKGLSALQRDRDSNTALDFRTFSRRTVGDSKALERRLRLVGALVRRLYPPADVDLLLDDYDLMASLGVTKLPQPLLIGGAISIDGVAVPKVPFMGVPPDEAQRLLVGQPEYMLTIENYVSFVRHCREINADGKALIVYTGGFPARATLRAIVHLASSVDCPVHHWGDLDPGGLRIFVHLERAMRSAGIQLRAHLMDSELLHARGRIDNEDNARAMPMTAPQDSAITALWTAMASLPHPMELEQEEIDPSRPFFNS
jgi:hypothetical protein